MSDSRQRLAAAPPGQANPEQPMGVGATMRLGERNYACSQSLLCSRNERVECCVCKTRFQLQWVFIIWAVKVGGPIDLQAGPNPTIFPTNSSTNTWWRIRATIPLPLENEILGN